MELITAVNAAGDQLEDFLKTNDNLDRDLLLEKGYVVLFNGKIEGCFVLDTVASHVHWLRQLYVTKEAASSLPVLLESILALAKENHARQVYVYSHQTMIDTILAALQFYPQEDESLVSEGKENEGCWWMYNVS